MEAKQAHYRSKQPCCGWGLELDLSPLVLIQLCSSHPGSFAPVPQALWYSVSSLISALVRWWEPQLFYRSWKDGLERELLEEDSQWPSIGHPQSSEDPRYQGRCPEGDFEHWGTTGSFWGSRSSDCWSIRAQWTLHGICPGPFISSYKTPPRDTKIF